MIDIDFSKGARKRQRMVSDLVKEVRKLDKEYGVRLRHQSSDIEPETFYKMNLQNSRIQLLSIVAVLNGQDPELYFTNNKGVISQIGRVEIDNDYFVKDSYFFHLENDMKYDINSTDFRARFISILCIELCKILGKIIGNIGRMRDDNISIWESKELVLHDIMRVVNNFILSYLENKDYDTHLFNLFLLTTDRKIKENKELLNRIKAVRKMTDNTSSLLVGYTKVISTEKLFTDDMVINNLLKLAYVCITENPDVSKTPKIPVGVSFEDEYVIRDLVRSLGKVISKQEEKSFIYKVFIRSIPNLHFKWKTINDDENLNLGCKALIYYDFITHNKSIHKIVKRMIIK